MQALTRVHAKQWASQARTRACVRARVHGCMPHTRPETKRQKSREVFVVLTILSNDPNLHLLSLRLIPESRGYALIMVSPSGQRRGRRTWGIIHCVTGVVRPQQTRSSVDEDTGRTPLPAQHSHSDLFLCPFFPQGCPSTSAPPGSQRLRWGGSFSSLPIPKTRQLSPFSLTPLPPKGTFSPPHCLQRTPHSEGQMMNVGIIWSCWGNKSFENFPHFRPHSLLNVSAEINLNPSGRVKSIICHALMLEVAYERPNKEQKHSEHSKNMVK